MDMSEDKAGGRKRKRSASPPTNEPSPPEAKKASRMQGIIDFFTSPNPKAGSAAGGARSTGKKGASNKKRISFGTPMIHNFDVMSPARRRRPEADDAALDAEKQETEALRVELQCRKEEEELNIDVEKADHKSMAKVVNSIWTRDQIALLKQRGVAWDTDKKLPRRELASRLQLMEAIERKGDVLMSGEYATLPDQMEMGALVKELKKRRITTEGDRRTLEMRLEDALLKEGSRFDVRGEDGYAFGRHSVSARNVIEELTMGELRQQLLLPHWGLSKDHVPKKRNDREDLLEKLVNEELDKRKSVAFDLALDNMLSSYGLANNGPKRERFMRLCDHLKTLPKGAQHE
eukprot:CAMPEP_0114123116 /NCGR_PEP_ID=MMETSP0043_2-20121206/8053_1 /TAXON_ID=464988 /ORGANISM="Hemiselmis andersenii, Strain CCMP644" /LENGTH=346 /DNA_ID=CAMNT_0001215869 /DNA_START=26 /DNA_END=1063 /DNA_ORIENTATION=-